MRPSTTTNTSAGSGDRGVWDSDLSVSFNVVVVVVVVVVVDGNDDDD
jgi:hypothetical protein